MKVYIDNDFKCHASNPEGAYTEAETDIFNGMCKEYIEGFRFVPSGKTWVRFDGVAFDGEMICAWRDWQALDAAQRDYEREQLAAYEQALSEIEAALGVTT